MFDCFIRDAPIRIYYAVKSSGHLNRTSLLFVVQRTDDPLIHFNRTTTTKITIINMSLLLHTRVNARFVARVRASPFPWTSSPTWSNAAMNRRNDLTSQLKSNIMYPIVSAVSTQDVASHTHDDDDLNE